MHRIHTHHFSGFTVVELIVVVTVIAIVSTISIMGYASILGRAEATKTTAAVSAYKDALLMYKSRNDAYPTAASFCLGDKYTVFTGGSTPSCRNSLSPLAVTSDSAARDTLKSYIGGQLPMPSMKYVHSSGGAEYIGAQFYGSNSNLTLDGKPVVEIEYYIQGSTCTIGPVYGNTSPTFTSPAVTRSVPLSDGSICFLLLAND